LTPPPLGSRSFQHRLASRGARGVGRRASRLGGEGGARGEDKVGKKKEKKGKPRLIGEAIDDMWVPLLTVLKLASISHSRSFQSNKKIWIYPYQPNTR